MRDSNDILSVFSDKARYALNKYAPDNDKGINAPMNYILKGEGKKIRASLVYATAEYYKIYDDNIDRIAAAIEMIHAYSLIHDDLPCMDNDDYRRGKPSCHKAFGQAEALLAGDGLLNMAYETLLGGAFNSNMLEASAYISKNAGVNGMVGGQYSEITKSVFTEKDLLEIDKGKTCALIKAAILGAAIYCSEKPDKLDLWERFALAYGLAFQIKDDLLDAEKEGNKYEEPSFVSVCGKKETEKMLAEHTKAAQQALIDLNVDKDSLFYLLSKNNETRIK